MSSTFNTAFVQAVGASLLVGVPYAFGLSFYGGFCQAFGLEESEFLLTIDRILYYGFYVITLIVLSWLPLFALSVASLIFYISQLLPDRSRVLESTYERLKVQKLLIHGCPLALLRAYEITMRFALILVNVCIVIFFASSVIWLIIFDASQKGKEQAESILQGIEEGRVAAVDIYLAGQPKQPIKGYPIYWLCNATHCAFLVEKQVVVYQRENIKRIVSHPKFLQKDATPAALPTK